MGVAIVKADPPPASLSAPVPGDGELLVRIAGGDEQAFEILIDTYLAGVVHAARRVLGDPAKADDIAQDAFLQLWRKAGDLVRAQETVAQGDFKAGAWLRRVAVNGAIDHLRSDRRLEVRDELPEQASAPLQHAALERSDAAARVSQHIAQLPDRQRVALSLFYFEGLRQREVAAAMDASEDAVESLLSRARRSLKQSMREEAHDLLEALLDSEDKGDTQI